MRLWSVDILFYVLAALGVEGVWECNECSFLVTTYGGRDMYSVEELFISYYDKYEAEVLFFYFRLVSGILLLLSEGRNVPASKIGCSALRAYYQ